MNRVRYARVLSFVVGVAGVVAQGPMEAGVLRVSVVGPDGAPREGVVVEVLRVGSDCTYRSLDLGEHEQVRTVAALPTPRSGSVAVQVPVAIPHRVRVDVAPFAIEWRSGVYAGAEVEIHLRDGAVLEGNVTDDTGRAIPAERVLVMPRGASPAHRSYVSAGDDGRFRIARLMPGNYYVDAESSRGAVHRGVTVSLVAGDNEPVAFVLDRGATVRGRVVDAATGRPVPGATIGVGWTYDKPVTTDADGRYELHGLGGPFANNLFVRCPGYAEQQIPRPTATGGEVTVDLKLERGVTVTGRIVDRDGRAVPGCYVAAVGFSTDGELSDSDWRSARTDVDGRYTIRDVRARLQPVLLVRHDGAATWTADLTIPAGSERVERDDIVLRPRRIVQGTLRDAAGDPMPGSKVELVGAHHGAPRRARPQMGMLSYYLPSRTVYTDDAGRFFFGDLGPGDYVLACAPFEQVVTVPADRDPEAIELAH